MAPTAGRGWYRGCREREGGHLFLFCVYIHYLSFTKVQAICTSFSIFAFSPAQTDTLSLSLLTAAHETRPQLTAELLGKLEESGVGMLHLQVKLYGLQQNPLVSYQLLLRSVYHQYTQYSLSILPGHWPTLGLEPKWDIWCSLSKAWQTLMMSRHFLGVSSTFPASRRHAEATTHRLNCRKLCSMKNLWKKTTPVAVVS